MANYAVGTGEIGCYAKTLVANVVDTVELAEFAQDIQVWKKGAPVYFTLDGSDPTVAGAHCFELPGEGEAVLPVDRSSITGETTVVKLISASTPSYSVSRAYLG